MVAEANLEHYRSRLADAQQTARRLRCEAFVDYCPTVAGIRLKQITLPSYNQLCALDCKFVRAGAGVEYRDILCFIWVHHPEFHQFNDAARMRVNHQVWRALNPRFEKVQALIRFISQLPKWRWVRRFIRPDSVDLQTEAIHEIIRLLNEALHDFPRDGGGDANEPLPFSFQAQVLNLMRRSLGLSFAETCALPLKALAQHLREIVHVESKGKASMLTADESRVWAEYQDWRQSQIRATTKSESK